MTTLLNLLLAWLAASCVVGLLAGAFLAKGLGGDDERS
jgi:hypothetical protein